MKMTAAILRKIFPSGRADLIQAMVKNWPAAEAAGINTRAIAAVFLGNVGAETGGLRRIEEDLNYSAKRLRQVWPARFKSDALAAKYAHKPEALANLVYGGRLGNTRPGDGWRYRGSGVLQTTGRENYRKAGYEGNPEALREPDTAILAAIGFWEDHGLSAIATNEVSVRKRINGGTNGLEEAKAYAAIARRALAAPAAPVALLAAPEATEVADELEEAVPEAPDAIVDADGDGVPDVVGASSTLEQLRGKLATANDMVTQVDMAKDSSIVRIGRRVIKGAMGTAAGTGVAAVGAAAGDEGSASWGDSVSSWLHAVPIWAWPLTIVCLVLGIAWYAHFNVTKRVQMQTRGLVLPEVKT
jgi:predicted chitinase